MLQAMIFITGGAILSLELLASRVLTPYFGVSLYIWSGILSITLISLALGYWLGGRLAAKNGRATTELTFLFVLMPAIAAISIVSACLAYPYLFYVLARFDLLAGAFIACIVLLFVPLVATSAMNPLLVAILLRPKAARSALADAGAGRVFFISTLGSVAGVIATAFGMIPHLSNFAALLVVAVILATLPLAALFGAAKKIAANKPLAITAVFALAASVGLLAAADAYIAHMWPVSYGGTSWWHEASYRSLFGTVKILRSAPRENGSFSRMYFQDGLLQNSVDSDNRSLSMYTYALEALVMAYRPELRSALVLGIGAGMVPMRLASHGIDVTAVDVDPVSVQAATAIFGFDRTKVRVHIADARTFLRSCYGGYDAVIVDTFYGDGVPEYLSTRDFFHDLKHCLGERGVAVFNTFADLDHPQAYAHLLTTLRTELPFIVLYRPNYGAKHVNSFIVAGSKPLPTPAAVELSHVPAFHLQTLAAMLSSPRPLDQDLLAHGRVITDSDNPVATDLALTQMINRRYVIEAMPAPFFMN
jgi:spermidine synthase